MSLTRRLTLYVAAAVLAAPAAAAQPGGMAPPAPAPKVGTVNADVVNVRCGPNPYYYPLVTVSQGTSLTVHAEADGWFEIAPPSGVHGLISRDDITLGEGGRTATVAVREARVYATGDRAERSWCVLATLSEGKKVRLAGPAAGQMLRIEPPPSARVYIASEFVTVREEAVSPPVPPPDNGGEEGPTDGGNGEAPPPPPPAAEADVHTLKEAEEALQTELEKPILERVYQPLVDRFTNLGEKVETDWLKRRTQENLELLAALVKRQEAYKRSLEIEGRLQEQLDAIRSGRAEAEAEAAERTTRPKFQATGIVGRLRFVDPTAQSPINYKLMDRDGRLLVVLKSKTYDLEEYVGRPVGVTGDNRYVSQWKVYLIEVDYLEVLE